MIPGPMYVIIRWTGNTWIVQHFSHDLDDALRIFLLNYEKHGKHIQLMIDDRILEVHDLRIQMNDLSKKVKEVRKNVQVQVTGLGNTMYSDSEYGGTTELGENK